MSNIIRVLADNFVPMTDILLADAYEWVADQECGAMDILKEDVAEALVAAVTSTQ